MFVFRSEDLRKLYGWSPIVTYQRLNYMAKKGLVKKIWRGTYMINPRLISSNQRILIIQGLVGSNYYFGLYTAMNYWRLSDAPLRQYQVITTRRYFSGKQLRILTMKIKFIFLRQKYFFGFIRAPFQGALTNISDIEKTIVDTTYFLGRHIIFNDLLKAIILAKNRMNTNKLIQYLRKIDSPFINQRLGFLLQKLCDISIRNKVRITTRYVLLDPAGPREAIAKDKNWRIIINRKISL
ncbi:hypothetical protein DRJ19_05360 [Candidatus Woesearchaeota archaeon]|nr:MAG: hypothetical protein DRJ19_05360 [Candidatus Woesearchaeota archaeon]